MSNNETNFLGNVSTIVKYVSMLIAGWFIGLLVNQGLNLPISTEGLSEIISAIIFLLLAHIDATHPNTIWNAKTSIDEIDLTGEYEESDEQ